MKGEKASHKVRRKTTQHEHSISAFLMVFFFSFILRFQSIARSVVKTLFFREERRKKTHRMCSYPQISFSPSASFSSKTLNFFSSSAHPVRRYQKRALSSEVESSNYKKREKARAGSRVFFFIIFFQAELLITREQSRLEWLEESTMNGHADRIRLVDLMMNLLGSRGKKL